MTIFIYTQKTKKCIQCKEIKSIDNFNKRMTGKYRGQCRICQNKANRDRYHNHSKNTLKKSSLDYYNNNKKHYMAVHKIYRTSLASYETYAHQLTVEEDPILSDDGVSLEVRCKYCGKYFKPTNKEVSCRVSVIKGLSIGELSLYCSDNCKKSCGTYRQRKNPKGFKICTSREVQPELRKLVLERDNYQCQSCDNIDIKPLHCHHYEGIEINPIESADIDNCITLCKKCHNAVHKHCDMRRKKC
jgi:5-methylcytosine-specific restriction endonuclease McrA